jgi:methionine synthase I (cobalamin-dependent)
MQTDWYSRLCEDDIVLLDGGVGSELRRRGVLLDAIAWSGPCARTHPELLQRIHTDYIRAGADIITTNTFATSRFVLAAAGLAQEFTTINGLAIQAAVAARAHAQRRVAIAGSMSCLPPGFDAHAYPDQSEERAAYHELARLLADGGVDLIVLEMMEDTLHARWAFEAARATGLPVVLGLSLRAAQCPAMDPVAFDFPQTSLAALLEALLPMGPTAVTIMHTPLPVVDAALEALSRVWGGLIGTYPTLDESGLDESGTARIAATPNDLVAAAHGWVARHARLLGSCCGSTPAHIRALAEARPSLLAAREARTTRPI